MKCLIGDGMSTAFQSPVLIIIIIIIIVIVIVIVIVIIITSCARGDTICPSLLLPCERPSASRAAEQTQRSSTFPRRIRSHADRCSPLTR